MKKLLFSLVAVAGLAFTSQAQTEKGKIMLGGSVGFSSSKVDGANKSDFSFNVIPSAGYFVSNNIAIGTGVGYTYNKEVSDLNLNQAFKVAPFGRYYVGLSDQFKFFGQLSVPMSFGNNKIVNADGDTGAKTATTTDIGVNIAPGFAFFPTKRIGIEFSVNGLGYNHSKIENEITGSEAKRNEFGLEADSFAPKLGVQFYF